MNKRIYHFMPDKNDQTLDEDFSEIQESDETDWKSETQKLREKAIRQREKTKALRDTLKEQEAKLAELEKPKTSKKSDEELLKRLDNLALKTAGINEADEKELFEKWKKETGRDTDSIIDSNIFKQELERIRTAKANQLATSNIKGETGVSGAKSEPDYWISKATKGADGKLMFPEEMPKELYGKVLDKLEGAQKGTGELTFYNSPKVG